MSSNFILDVSYIQLKCHKYGVFVNINLLVYLQQWNFLNWKFSSKVSTGNHCLQSQEN